MPLRKPHNRPAEVADPLVEEIENLREQLRRSQAQIETLEKRAHEDALTGLLNRRGFAKAFDKAIAYGKRYQATAALLFLDLDGFKQINDEHGHATGDVVLAEVARLISGSVRGSDVVARIGGDEMVALLWNIDAAQAEAKARVLEDFISDIEFEADGKNFGAGISVGSTVLADDDTLEAALKRADAAMYVRKKERRK